MTREYKYWWLSIESDDLGPPYFIKAERDGELLWDCWVMDSVDDANKIYALLEDFKRALKCAGYIVVKENQSYVPTENLEVSE